MILGEIRDLLQRLLNKGVFETPLLQVPGVATAAAYLSGDAFGSIFELSVPRRFKLQSITFVDLDNELIPKDVVFYTGIFSPTADNAVLAPATVDLLKNPKVVTITALDFVAFSANGVATVTGIELPLECPDGKLRGQWITRGTDNIAAGAIPFFSISGEVL